MTEEAELLAQIGELAGQINRQKNRDVTRKPSLQQPNQSHRRRKSIPRSGPYGRGSGLRSPNKLLLTHHGQRSDRAFSAPGTPHQAEGSGDENATSTRGGVSKYGRGAKAWISEESLRRKLERRKLFATNQPVTKDSAVEDATALQDRNTSSSVGYISVDEISFRVTSGGRKLLRIIDPTTSTKATPKEAIVSGVTFKRTTHGNLVRTGFPHQEIHQSVAKSQLCRKYTSTGQCSRGDKCLGIHDLNRTAICSSVLRGTECAAGDDCDLAHQSSSQVAPTCLHFLRGKCTKHPCPYSHAPVNPSAPICRDFAYLGYCETGSDCANRHLRECPDYNAGPGCRTKRCPLPHIDRASQMRRNATKKAEISDEVNVDCVSSGAEAHDDIDSDDVDSDENQEPEEMFGSHSYSSLHQEQDFVGLI